MSLLLLESSSFPGHQGYIVNKQPICLEQGELQFMISSSTSPVGPYVLSLPMVIILPGIFPVFATLIPFYGANSL